MTDDIENKTHLPKPFDHGQPAQFRDSLKRMGAQVLGFTVKRFPIFLGASIALVVRDQFFLVIPDNVQPGILDEIKKVAKYALHVEPAPVLTGAAAVDAARLIIKRVYKDRVNLQTIRDKGKIVDRIGNVDWPPR